MEVVETSSSDWKSDVLAVVRHPRKYKINLNSEVFRYFRLSTTSWLAGPHLRPRLSSNFSEIQVSSANYSVSTKFMSTQEYRLVANQITENPFYITNNYILTTYGVPVFRTGGLTSNLDKYKFETGFTVLPRISIHCH